MKKKKVFLRIAEVFSLVGAGVYCLYAAYAFSLRDPIYWLLAVLALVALFSGLALSSFLVRLPLDSRKKKIEFWIASACSIVSFLPFLFAVVSYISDEEASVEDSEKKIEDEVSETKPPVKRKWFKRPAFIVSCVSLGVIALAGFSGSLFESSAYSVSVTDFCFFSSRRRHTRW